MYTCYIFKRKGLCDCLERKKGKNAKRTIPSLHYADGYVELKNFFFSETEIHGIKDLIWGESIKSNQICSSSK